MLVVGLAILAGLSIATANVAGHVDGSALQALNALAQDATFVFLITIGTGCFMLGAGVSVLKTAVLPAWLGWVDDRPRGRGRRSRATCSGATLDHVGFLAFAAARPVPTLIVAVDAGGENTADTLPAG